MNEYEVNQCVESFYLPGYVDKSADRAILEVSWRKELGVQCMATAEGTKHLANYLVSYLVSY